MFKGIPETSGEKKGKNSWNEMRNVLAQTLATHIPGVSAESASQMIERVHRGKANAFNISKRPIYARYFDWNVSEKIKTDLKLANMADNSIKIYVEQMYGPRTRYRRGLAMSKRRDLKREGKIFSGFVSYPAKLMVKYTNDSKEKYSLLEDFSKTEVKFQAKIDDAGDA